MFQYEMKPLTFDVRPDGGGDAAEEHQEQSTAAFLHVFTLLLLLLILLQQVSLLFMDRFRASSAMLNKPFKANFWVKEKDKE